MDIWKLLEIQPTSDTKAIKKAYAKKLKVTRPDENPKAFQDLHFAYKAALEEADYLEEKQNINETPENAKISETTESFGRTNIPETMEILKTTEASETNHHELTLNLELNSEHTESISANPVSMDSTPVNLEPDSQSITDAINPYQQEGDRLLGIAKMLLMSDGEQSNSKSWEFIINSPYILDDHFNWRLGIELLHIIHEHNLHHAAKVKLLVGQEALNYLNSIFNWSDNRYHILRSLGNEYSTWLDLIQEPGNQSQKNWADQIRGGKKLVIINPKETATAKFTAADILTRFYAWLIDLFVIVVLILLLADGKSTQNTIFADSRYFSLICLGMIYLYYVFFEISNIQGTIGKRICGLKVVTVDGNPIPVKTGLVRTFLYLLFYLLPSFLMGFISHNADNILLSNAAFIGVLGWYCYIGFKSVNLYDKLSNTLVVRYSKT